MRSHFPAAFSVVEDIKEIIKGKFPILTSYFVNSQVVFLSALSEVDRVTALPLHVLPHDPARPRRCKVDIC